MNKHDVIAKIARDTGATKSHAAAVVDSLLEGITGALQKGHQDSETPRRPLYGRKNPQKRGPVKVLL
jgi:hypothetical protein